MFHVHPPKAEDDETAWQIAHPGDVEHPADGPRNPQGEYFGRLAGAEKLLQRSSQELHEPSRSFPTPLHFG
jgi:hypothetical protein